MNRSVYFNTVCAPSPLHEQLIMLIDYETVILAYQRLQKWLCEGVYFTVINIQTDKVKEQPPLPLISCLMSYLRVQREINRFAVFYIHIPNKSRYNSLLIVFA